MGSSKAVVVLKYDHLVNMVKEYLRERIGKERGSVLVVKTKHLVKYAERKGITCLHSSSRRSILLHILLNDLGEAVVSAEIRDSSHALKVIYDKRKLKRLLSI